MRFRCALVASIAGSALASPARADDPRDAFGLPARAAAPAPACGDGRDFGCATATDPLDDATPYALSTWLPAGYLRRLPVGDATHDGVASYALGASRDGGGPVFGGASGLENRWTIEGAPADNIRTGGVDTRVPLAFVSGVAVTAGGFSARDRANTGGTIDAQLIRGTREHEVTADVWAGLSLSPRERPTATGSYSVRRLSIDSGLDDTASVVATGPVRALGDLIGGTAWYAAGIAPNLATTNFAWRAARLVDDNGDGVPDGLPGDVALATIERSQERTLDYFVPVMARLGLDRGAHHVDVTLIGHDQRDTRFLGNSTLQAAGVDRTTWTGDAIATWRARLGDTQLRAQLAWHHSARTDAAHDGAAAKIPQVLSAYVPAVLPDDPVLAAACDDASPSDPVPTVTNCRVPFGFFASAGAGPLTSVVGDRPSATVELGHRLGDHTVRAGFTVEDSQLVTTSSLTGGEQELTLFEGENDRHRFYQGSCSATAGDPCDYVSSSRLSYRTIYSAAYLEDSTALRPGLVIDAGVRWELMWVGPRVHFSDQLAPRFGVTWDPLGGGRSRLWASYARTFAMLPAGLGPTVIQRDATVDDLEFPGGIFRGRDAGSAYSIARGLQPVEQNEITVGGEVALAGALRATVWGQGRYLRHGLETTARGFDNPGASPATADVPAIRETELVAFALEIRQPRTALRAGVQWGRTVGTWTGPYDPRLGGNLLRSPDWDGNVTNLNGPLPTDSGSRAFVEAERTGSLGGVAVSIATRATVASGTPRNILADGIDGIVELLPRGSAGRNPVIAQANLRLAARWQGVTVTLDVFNLFARRDITNLDEVYSADTVSPITGGSAEDLVFLKSASGQAATRQTAFQLPTEFQAPLSISLGVHKAF